MDTKHNTKFEREMKMYFQTSFRNVGLYTTVSFAILGYSRYYRDKIEYYNIILILCSLIVLLISFLLNTYLYQDLHKFKELEVEKNIEISRWTLLNSIMFLVHSILILLGVITLLRYI